MIFKTLQSNVIIDTIYRIHLFDIDNNSHIKKHFVQF